MSQPPTPLETPADQRDQKKNPKDDLTNELLDDVSLPDKFKLSDGFGDLSKSELGGKEKDMKEEAESPEAAIKSLRERVSSIEIELRESGFLGQSADELATNLDELETHSDEEEGGLKQPITIPKLRYVEWEEFKHKYANEEETYPVEVLIGEARYYYHQEEDLKNIRMGRGTTPKVQPEVAEKKGEPRTTNVKSSKVLPERIRINSKHILAILGQIDSEDEWVNELQPNFTRMYNGRTFFGNVIERCSLLSLLCLFDKANILVSQAVKELWSFGLSSLWFSTSDKFEKLTISF